MKKHFLNFLWGIALTALIMLVPYQFCMDGPGRGFPLAVYRPSCGGAWFPVFAFDESKIPQILDLGGFIGDVLVWGTVAALVRSIYCRRETKDECEKSK